MSQREKFINSIIKVDDDFIYRNSFRLREGYTETMKKEGYKSLKELFLSHSDYDMHLSHLDIDNIKHLTNNYALNPFKEICYLDENTLKELIQILAKTHQALRYYNEYSSRYRDLKEKNKKTKEQQPITNKLHDVVNIIKDMDIDISKYLEKKEKGIEVYDNYIPQGYKTIMYLENLIGSLKNNHYTKRQLYHNLLFEINNLLKDKEYPHSTTKKERKFSKKVILEIVDKLIRNYFKESELNEITSESDKLIFTDKMDISKFITLKYSYETMAGIELTHGKK